MERHKIEPALDAVSAEIADFTVGFVIVRTHDGEQDAYLAGSGSLVAVGSVNGILTAAHVLKNLPDEAEVGLVRFPRNQSGVDQRFLIDMGLSDKASLSEDAAWQVSTNSGHVRYSTHGTTVRGHQFGFVKLARRCDDDILWLSWSSDDPQVKRLIKSKVKLLIDVDGISFRIGVDLTTASSLIPLTTVVLFTNFLAGPTFVDLLNRGKKIGITISEPASQLFDLPHDEFSLAGFAVARQQAKKTCEERVI